MTKAELIKENARLREVCKAIDTARDQLAAERDSLAHELQLTKELNAKLQQFRTRVVAAEHYFNEEG